MKKIIFILFINSIFIYGFETSGSLSLQHTFKKDKITNLEQLYNINIRDESWNLKINNNRGKITFGQRKGDFRYKEYYLVEMDGNKKEGGGTLYYKNLFNLEYIESNSYRSLDGKYQQNKHGGRLKYLKNKGKTEEYLLYLNQNLWKNIHFFENLRYETNNNYNIMLRSKLWWFTFIASKTHQKLTLAEQYKYNNYDRKIYLKIKNSDILEDNLKNRERKQELYVSKGYKNFEFIYNYIKNEVIRREVSYEINGKNSIRFSYNNLYYELNYNYFDINKNFTYSLKKSEESWDNSINFYYKKGIQENLNYKISGDTDFKKEYEIINELEYLF